jgi:glycosyltransferase involved in cell wall biosynthesis
VAKPRIALVHDWMVSPGGAERLLYSLHQLWPDAPIYTTAYRPEKFPEFSDADVRPIWLDKIPLMRTKHQFFPPARAFAWNVKRLSGYDIVISSSTAEAKYVRAGHNTLHICYCHTPVRYYWSDYDWYRQNPPFGRLNWLAQIALPLLIGPLRWVDYRGSKRVDRYIANSNYVRERIKRYYHRDAAVIYPPIVTSQFELPRQPQDYYLIWGRQVAYKRLDLAIDAFNQLGLPLKVAGAGEEVAKQQARSEANIEFLGRVSDAELQRLLAGAKAVIFPPEEDFGLIPVEAMAAGCPVIAYGAGGALESVVEGLTGTFFAEQTPDSLVEALQRFNTMSFNEERIREHARTFDDGIFKSKMKAYVDDAWRAYQERSHE